MLSKLKPGALVGAALGILLVLTGLISGLTGVGFLGCCNCLWPIAAGLLAGLWFIKSSPTQVRFGDGAVVGFFAGLVAALIYLVIGMPITYFVVGVAAMDAQIHQLNPNFPLNGLMLLIIGGVVGSLIFVALAIVGGLIAVPIFEKRKDTLAPPPPPSDMGGSSGFSSAA